MDKPKRITVMWVEDGPAEAQPEFEKMSRHDRRHYAAFERQLFAKSKSWPVFRCSKGHAARVDPEFAESFAKKPCAKCGAAMTREGAN